MESRAVVVITGASSGIGRTTAEVFAARGCRLVLSARREGLLKQVSDELNRRYGVEAVPVTCDVRHAVDVQRLIDTAVERFGRLDVLVANAGVALYARVEDTSEEDLRDLLETNVFGVHRCIRAAVPIMRRQRRGHIAVIGSVAGKQAWPFHGAYAASKFALTGLTQSLRAELAGSGVTASLILPGSTRTDFFRAAKVRVPRYQPRPRGLVQTPETVARAVLRSVDHPLPEVNTFPPMRAAFVLAEAFPGLAALAGRCYYAWMARWLRLDNPRPGQPRIASKTDEAG
jgi:short-subunit dehydrogenase